MSTQPIPQGVSILTPHLIVKDAKKAIEFYKHVFCAEELHCMMTPDGKNVMHAAISIAGQTVFLGEPCGTKAKTPGRSGSYLSLHLYVGDVDMIFHRALEFGAKEVMSPENMFWGDRYAKVRDPFGVHWDLATHVEDVAPEEMHKRAEKMMMAGAK